MAEKIKWTQAETEKLIYLVQQYECIYNVKSAGYLDRTAKAQAFIKICEDLEMQELDVTEVKKKWKNLRTQFLREMRELRASKKSGSGVCDVYTPKLWCFTQLEFLEAHTKIRSGQSNFEDLSPPLQSPVGTSSGVSNFSQLSSGTTSSDESNFSLQSPGATSSSVSHSSLLSPPMTSSEFIDITTDASSSGVSKEPHTKRAKNNALCRLRQDLVLLKEKIGEKRRKPFAWLGNLVATKMEEIIPEQQDDAAWEVECLMRRLVLKSKNASSSQPAPNDMLQNAMSGVFDETDFE